MALIKRSAIPNSSPASDEMVLPISDDELLMAFESKDRNSIYKALRQLELSEGTVLERYSLTLTQLLDTQDDIVILELIFSVLEMRMNEVIFEKLLTCLQSDNVFIRNRAIEALQHHPGHLEPRINELLIHEDSDVRIFVVDILSMLPHPKVPEWINTILQTEQHVNVVGAAIDRATQLDDPLLVGGLESAKQRFSDIPYIRFACDIAIKRLNS